MRNLAMQYFTYRANEFQEDGFGAYEFFTYELETPRVSPCWSWTALGQDEYGGDCPSDAEMYGLAGFSGREEFLEDFHRWVISNMDQKRTPYEVAEEITQPQADLLADIERLKARNRVVDDGAPRCGDADLPIVDHDEVWEWG